MTIVCILVDFNGTLFNLYFLTYEKTQYIIGKVKTCLGPATSFKYRNVIKLSSHMCQSFTMETEKKYKVFNLIKFKHIC